MILGCLGDILFSVNSYAVRTIDNAVWSGKARYAVHQRHNGHALTEYTGLEPDSFTFDMEFSVYYRMNPTAELARLWRYEREGVTLPLVIGDKAYGKYRWVIVSHTVNMQQYDRRGNLYRATVSVTLQEYLKE